MTPECLGHDLRLQQPSQRANMSVSALNGGSMNIHAIAWCLLLLSSFGLAQSTDRIERVPAA